MSRVLVVDDSPVDRHLATSLLEKSEGLRVSHAADGKEALAAVERQPPDLVVTDLQMPEMNGLQLVEALRSRFPAVPVILMTAHGSDEIAAQALKRGAASYVPKRNLAQDLRNTVETVLLLAQADRNHRRLLECLTQTESHFFLENDPSLIPPLIGYLTENLLRMKLCDEGGLIRVTVALGEALDNAIHHGNLELSSELKEQDEAAYRKLAEQRRQEAPYKDRRVHVIAKETHAEAAYVVRDEGPGFDPSGLPDPTDPSNLERITGRGLLLVRTFMDQVYHNETGNQITMFKRRER